MKLIEQAVDVVEKREKEVELTGIKIATVSGSAHSSAKELVEIFNEMLDVDITLATVSSQTEANSIGFNRLLLLGGSDIDPSLYGEKSTHSQTPSKWRDDLEWTLLTRARQYGVPTMGICRGHQMIAAHYGGTLYQDFGKQVGTNHYYQHRLVDVKDPLARFLPTTTTNSLHHQSVKDVPPGFEVLARASDGIIESIGKDGILGVQFHPEMMIEDDAFWTGLFCWFILDGLSWDV